jgi:hypothetical protein
MAKATTPSPAPKAPDIDPEANYRVTLTRAVRVGKNGDTVLSPAKDNVVKGKVIATLGDAVESYALVET